jgi:hypothetical protein
MMTRRSAAVCLALFAAVATSAVPSAQRSERTVYVTALDRAGTPIVSVGPDDLVIKEDGVSREILRIVPAGAPMQITVMVDNSQVTQGMTSDVRKGLAAFLTAVSEDVQVQGRHQMSLVTLAARPTLVVDATTDVARLVQAADRVFPETNSGTYLLDGIIEISNGFERRGATRPVIVAVVTEGPELSNRMYQQVLEPLRRSGASLHIVVVGRIANADAERSVVIERGPAQSGGSFRNVLTSSALPAALQQLATELTHQFQATYARPDALIPPETIAVSSPRADWTVRGPAVLPPGGRGR